MTVTMKKSTRIDVLWFTAMVDSPNSLNLSLNPGSWGPPGLAPGSCFMSGAMCVYAPSATMRIRSPFSTDL